jgi:hypothetical protein
MKSLRLFAIFFVVMGLNLASLHSAQADELDDIIVAYCDEVLRNVDDTVNGLDNAAQDLSRCDDKLNDCGRGVFGGNPASCFFDFGRCIADGGGDAQRECSEFSRELTEDTKHAQNQAVREGVASEFTEWFQDAFSDSESCLAPARGTSVLCTGSQTLAP